MQLPILGEVIYWRMEGVRVDIDLAKEKAKDLQLNVMIEGLTEVGAMRKALDRLAKSEDEDIIWRSSDKEDAYYVAKVEVVDGIKTESSVTIKKVKQQTGDIVFDYLGDSRLCSKVREEFNYWRSQVDAGKMIECLVRFVEGPLSGVRLRKGGGVYFVKRDYLAELDKLEKWLKEINASVIISRIKLVDEERTLNEIAMLFVEKIKEDMEEIKSYVDKVLKEDLRRNASGINTRMEKLNKMKEDLKLYIDVISQAQKTELEEKLKEIETSMFLLNMEK